MPVRLLFILAACAATLALAASPAGARRALPTVVQDDAQLLHRSEADIIASMATLARLGTDRVRITAGWSVLARQPDSETVPDYDQSDPAAYEQDRFATLDRAVRLAVHHGLGVMIDIAFWAPHWATSDKPGPRARTHIDTEAYRRFAVAVARRYSGAFVPPRAAEPPPPPLAGSDEEEQEDLFGSSNPQPPAGVPIIDIPPLGQILGGGSATTRNAGPTSAEVNPAGAPLPRVGVFTLWNEPNHPAFFMPQHIGRKPWSPHAYRRMVHAAYPAIKQVRPDATVLVGGLSANGTGGRGVAPLRFLRELACVHRSLRPRSHGACAGFAQVPGDGYAHHPYSLRTLPDARNPRGRGDDAPIGELDALSDLLVSLVRRGRLARGWADLWITEYGYESNPPDLRNRFSTGDQARFLTWAEYLAWRNPRVRTFAQFLLRDLPPAATRQSASARRGFGQWESGLAFADGRPKLAAASFQAGIFVRRSPVRPGRVLVFGRLRGPSVRRDAVLELRRTGSASWRAVSTRAVSSGRQAVAFATRGVVHRSARHVRGARYRLRWHDGGAWLHTPSVGVER